MEQPWMTPQVREAEARVDGLMSELSRTVAATTAKTEQVRATGLSPKDLAEIERYARGGKAPRELRELQQRIDKGELSWQDIASGRAMRDEGVQRALSAGLPDLARAYEMLQEGQSGDDIINAGPSDQRPPTRADDVGDEVGEDDDGTGSIMRRAW